MNDNTSLSDLCRICNDATPKYCCPRCSTRTCSLACYKRHQIWSQCSGKRDPGAYVKRSQLATAAGIDHDYNFLTGIERAFDNADRDVEERGMVSTGRRRKEANPGSNIGKRLAASGVIIKRAPMGMSRQKSNRTQWIPRHECIAWTVEWVHADGRKQLGQCRENLAISEGYSHTVPNPAKRRKASIGGESTPADSKRARGRKPASETESKTSVEDALFDANGAKTSKTDVVSNVEAIISSIGMANSTTVSTLDDVQHPQDDQHPSAGLDPATATVTTTTTADLDQSPTKTITSAPNPSPPPLPPPRHYYLHSPLSSSPLPVLIPLTPTSTLSTCLANRLVLEYPTIYVLDDPPSSLPDDAYLLEAEYKKREKKMIEELDEEERALGVVEASGEMTTRRGKVEEEVDAGVEERRVLESLRRDVSALGGGL